MQYQLMLCDMAESQMRPQQPQRAILIYDYLSRVFELAFRGIFTIGHCM